MLSFLLFQFLPRRLLPLITLFELYRLFRRWQVRDRARPPARLAVSEPAPTAPMLADGVHADALPAIDDPSSQA